MLIYFPMSRQIQSYPPRTLSVKVDPIEFLTDEELLSIIQTAERRWQLSKADCRRFETHRDYSLVQYLFHTGVRIGEGCALEWSKIDRINGLVHSITLKRRTPVLRTIPITLTLASILMDYRYEAEKHCRENTGRHACKVNRPFGLTPDRAAARLKTVMKEARISERKAHPHIFRHTYAVRAVISGMPPLMLARILGHASVTTTMDYYHLLGSDARPFVERITTLQING